MEFAQYSYEMCVEISYVGLDDFNSTLFNYISSD